MFVFACACGGPRFMSGLAHYSLPQSSLRQPMSQTQGSPTWPGSWPAFSGDPHALSSEARITDGPVGPPDIYLHRFMGDPNSDSHTKPVF